MVVKGSSGSISGIMVIDRIYL